MKKFALIPTHLQEDLDRQDAARAKARARGETENTTRLYDGIRAQVGRELLLVHWGAEADTRKTEFGEEVVTPIRYKYPVRKFSRFEMWLMTTFKLANGTPVFQLPPAKGLRGFIFNEGGRGITFSWLPNRKLYRLYVAGWTLMRNDGRWSFGNRH